jgi:hypothetical protein
MSDRHFVLQNTLVGRVPRRSGLVARPVLHKTTGVADAAQEAGKEPAIGVRSYADPTVGTERTGDGDNLALHRVRFEQFLPPQDVVNRIE